jgi:hypothetical protein
MAKLRKLIFQAQINGMTGNKDFLFTEQLQNFIKNMKMYKSLHWYIPLEKKLTTYLNILNYQKNNAKNIELS